MREFNSSDDDLKAIAHDRYHHPHPLVQRKMEVLWLKSHGLPYQQIAHLAGVSLRTVQRYLDDYHQGGLTLLRHCSWRGPQTVLLRHERSLEEYFWDHPPRSTKEAAKVIGEQTGVRRGLTQVRAFLKTHLGLRYRKVAAIPVPVSVTNPMKRQVMQEYGLDGQDPRLYEGDHEISIEIGGCPGPGRACDFHGNFWPQKWASPNGAHDKDAVENAPHRLVCSGRLPLTEAQHRIATDWRHALDDLNAP